MATRKGGIRKELSPKPKVQQVLKGCQVMHESELPSESRLYELARLSCAGPAEPKLSKLSRLPVVTGGIFGWSRNRKGNVVNLMSSPIWRGRK